MASFQPFEQERIMSTWEGRVDYNLSESGVHPITLRELVPNQSKMADLLDLSLGYPECNGDTELRQRIAALYPGADVDNILVTVGCAEANFVSTQTLVPRGEAIAMMVPNYMQIWGLAHNFGLERKAFHLREEDHWGLDVDELDRAVSKQTRLIAVCNPNNPTGHILTPSEIEAIVAAADRVGAWILADETYCGSERLSDTPTPSLWGRYERVVVTSSLSKAYGLPGLRLGWIVAPAGTIAEIWARHDYITISAAMLANKLAALALSDNVREMLIRRGRDFIRRGYPILEGWLHAHPETFSLVPPQAAAIAFVRYHLKMNSTDLAQRLIREKSLFVVPGDCFCMDGFVRISFGMPEDILVPALNRLEEFVQEANLKFRGAR